MMHIALDYAAGSGRRSHWRLGSILLLAAVLAWLGWHAHQLQAQVAGLELRMQDRQRAVASTRPMHSIGQDVREQRITEANRLLAELGIPWNRLFHSLEEVATPQIAMLEIRPAAAKARLQIAGEADSLPALLAYVRALEALDTLKDVSIQEHKALADYTAQAVGFRLQAAWEMQR